MDWMTSIQQTVDYIEEHIDNDLDIDMLQAKFLLRNFIKNIYHFM